MQLHSSKQRIEFDNVQHLTSSLVKSFRPLHSVVLAAFRIKIDSLKKLRLSYANHFSGKEASILQLPAVRRNI